MYEMYSNIEEVSGKIDTEILNKNFKVLEESILRGLINQQKLIELNNALNIAFVEQEKYKPTTTYDVDKYIFNSDNRPTGQFSLPSDSKYSLIPKIKNDDDDFETSPDVSIKLFIGNTEVTNVKNIKNVCDTNDATIWMHKVGKDKSGYIEISVPPALTNRFNYIKMQACPMFGFNLKGVEYKDQFGNTDFKEAVKIDTPCSYHEFYTKPTQYNGSIKIKFSTTGEQEYIGFSNIDFGFIDFTNEKEFTFKCPSAGNYKLNFDFTYDTSIIKKCIIIKNGDTTLEYTVSSNKEITLDVPLVQNVIYKLILKEYNFTTPIVKFIEKV